MTAAPPTAPLESVERWIARFDGALRAGDVDGAADCFEPDGFWRDLVAFSWNLITAEGRDAIRDMLDATLPSTEPRDWRVSGDVTVGGDVTETFLEFRTTAGRGVAHLRLRGDRAFTLLTTLRELDARPERRGTRRPLGAEHGIDPERRSWQERRDAERDEMGLEVQPEVLIVGGGQAGLALGARLRQLDVPTLIVDAHGRAGDQWRRRYKSLCLHDPVWMDHLPYMPFPDTWPVFAPKDRIADWLEGYAEAMELVIWGNSTVRRAAYDEETRRWSVSIRRGGDDVTVSPRQLVLATGLSGRPNVPEIPGQEEFAGEQHHSSEHPGPDGYAGRRVVVVGSNNSAFDICGALYETGAEVTMVQRSPTHVIRSDTARRLLFDRLYSEEAIAAGIDADRADLLLASLPHRLGPVVQKPLYDRVREVDAEFYGRLERAGFRCDFGPDGTGMSMRFLRRASGYYIDVGAAELVADGRVALAHGSVARLTEHAVVLDDGTELPADLVVYATGYGPMNDRIAELISPEVAARVGPIWGLGSGVDRDPGPWEGELRGMWKPTAQPGLWIHAGNLQMSRHYSLYLALHLAARYAGLPTPVYRDPSALAFKSNV